MPFCSGTAPELYAVYHQKPCSGADRCHWCGAPCGRIYKHDDPPPALTRDARQRSTAKVPSSPWICNGCFLWKQRSTTVFFQDRSFEDRRCAEAFSWIFDEKGAAAVRREKDGTVRKADAAKVYEYLLHPPTKRGFVICLATSGNPTLLHQGIPNYTSSGFTAASPIQFTLNGIPHTYSVQELELAARTGQVNGKEPGVRVLFDFLGAPASGVVKLSENGKNGRPEEDQGQQQRRKV